MLPRTGDYALSVDVAELDREKIEEICRKVGLAPGEAICACTFVTAQELAGAVLLGAKTPEDVCAMTGVRRGCGIYCLVNIFKILDAGGVQAGGKGQEPPLSPPLELAGHPRGSTEKDRRGVPPVSPARRCLHGEKSPRDGDRRGGVKTMYQQAIQPRPLMESVYQSPPRKRAAAHPGFVSLAVGSLFPEMSENIYCYGEDYSAIRREHPSRPSRTWTWT